MGWFSALLRRFARRSSIAWADALGNDWARVGQSILVGLTHQDTEGKLVRQEHYGEITKLWDQSVVVKLPDGE